MTDNITLPRAVVEQVREALKELDYASEPYVNEIARTTLAALDAALAEPERYPEKGSALSVYNGIAATDDPGSPLERLRFFYKPEPVAWWHPERKFFWAAPNVEVPPSALPLYAALAEPEKKPEPSGYAYRYNDGVLRFNDGTQINGARPIEALPYFFAPPAAALAAALAEPKETFADSLFRRSWEAHRAALAEPEQKPEPVAYLYHDAQTAQDAHPLMHSTMLVLATDRRPEYRNETPLYTAPPQPVHPGYIIGSHWLETAYSRIAAGEAEADVLAEVLGARGWAKREPATDAEMLKAYRESAADGWQFCDGWRDAERHHGIRKEDGK